MPENTVSIKIVEKRGKFYLTLSSFFTIYSI